MAQKTIRETVIELAIKLRIAKMNYIMKDSAMIDKACPEYKKWLKASDAVFAKMNTPEFMEEIKKNGIVTAKEVDAAFDAKFKPKAGDFGDFCPSV